MELKPPEVKGKFFSDQCRSGFQDSLKPSSKQPKQQ